MSYIDQITVGSTTYDIQDSNAQRKMLEGAGAPTTSTVGTIGQHYYNTSATEPPFEYICTGISGSTYTWVPFGMTILSYGHSTWTEFINAYNAHEIVYCRASSGTNPASGSQTRMAFMAYVDNATNPTNVEFQYYRSVNSHSASQQGDQMYVYKLTNAGTWSVTVRENYTKIIAGTGLTSSYANSAITLNVTPELPSVSSSDDGKVLTVASGAWSAAEVDALPAVTSADDGKVLSVASGEWTVAEVDALPTVSSSDNGKYLGVDNGDWAIVNGVSDIYYGTTTPTDPAKLVWIDPSGDPDGGSIPSGGSAGQVLKKRSGTDYDFEWGAVEALPSGGSVGQVLKKKTTTDYDVEWGAVEALPSGGTTGQLLAKKTGTDYDIEWVNPPQGSVTDVTVNGTSVVTSGVAQVTVPTASSSSPADLGTASAGSSANFARSDHVHNVPIAAHIPTNDSNVQAELNGLYATVFYISLLYSDWVSEGNGVYSQDVTITDGTARTKVDLHASMAVIQQMIVDGTSSIYIRNDNGSFKAYALGNPPSALLTVQATRYETIQGAQSVHAVLKVKAPIGSTVTITKDDVSYTSQGEVDVEPDLYKYQFNIDATLYDSINPWTIVASKGTDSTTEYAIVDTSNEYDVNIWSYVPSEYKAVRYIESTGTQHLYLDLGTSKDLNALKWVVDLTMLSCTNSSCFIGDSQTSPYFIFLRNVNGTDFYPTAAANGAVDGTSDMSLINERHIYTYDGDNGAITIYKDNDVWYTGTRGVRSRQTLIILSYYNGSALTKINAKLFSFKVFDTDHATLLREWYPCYRKSDKVAGVFDKVTSTFLTNQGSGEFLLSEDHEGDVNLFKNGNEFTSVTGGWSATGYTYSGTTNAAVNDGTYMCFDTTSTAMWMLGTNNMVETAGFTNIKVNVRQSNSTITVVFAKSKSSFTSSAAVIKSAALSGAGVITVPLSGASQTNGYVAIYVYSANGAHDKIDHVWLE